MFFGVWDFIFQLSRFQIRSSGGFLPLPSKPPQEPHAGPTGPVWSFGGVASLPRPLTGHKSPHRGEFVFPPQNEFTPPPKGGGAGYHLTWLAGILMQRSQVLFRRKRRILRIRGLLSAVACDNCWPQLPHTAPTARVWGLAGVPHLYPVPKSAHRAAQGRVWFSPAYWRFSGGFPSLSAIPYKNSGRRKNTSALLFKNRTS